MELRGGIIASYATGAVTGTTVGGLVGRSDGPSVFERSYATGRVSGNLDVGGLVGTNASPITASYSTGPASATYSTGSSVGGLVGANEPGFHRIRASYWDSTTSGIAGGQSTAALQGPTGDTGIYGTWNRGGGASGPWDFGTSAQYPVLSVDFDGDGNETWQEFGHQLRAGPALTATRGTEQVVLDWPPVDAGHWTPAPGITYTLYRDATVVAENLSTLSHQDSGLTAGDYTYQLAAVVNGGEATRSALVTVTVRDSPEVEVSFGSATYSVPEGGTRSVTVNLSADPERTVTIPIATSPQLTGSTAVYTVPTTVTFASGETSKSIIFGSTQDSIDNDGESVKLSFGSSLPAGVEEGTTKETIVSITDDDDPAVTVSFGSPTYSVPEGGTQSVTVRLSPDPERSVVIRISAAGQDGAVSGDYSITPASLTFNSGGREQKTFTFTAVGDTDDDDGESVKLSFRSLPDGVTASGTTETVVSIRTTTTPRSRSSSGPVRTRSKRAGASRSR